MSINRRNVILGGAALWVGARRAAADPAANASERIAARVTAMQAGADAPLEVLVPQGSEPSMTHIITAFRRLTGIKVRITSAPVDDINTSVLLNELSGGRRVDLAVVASFGVADLAEAGVIVPINAMEARFPFARELRQRSLYTLADSIGDDVYGPQYDGDLYMMFYNRALLEDATLAEAFAATYGEPPRPARTWPELDRLMRFYHAPEANRFGGALFRTPRYIAWEFWARMHAAGVLPFDRDMQPQIRSAGAVGAIEQLVAASASQHADVDTLGLVGNWQLFANGQTLCNIGWGGSQKYFKANAAQLPAGVITTQLPGSIVNGETVPIPYFNWGWNLAIPASASNPELSYLLAAFATTPEVSTTAVAEVRSFFDPFQDVHYDNATVRDTYGDAFLQTHREGMRSAIPDLYLRGHRHYMGALSANLLLANRGELSPVEAAEAIHRRWQATTDSYGRASQVRQWRALLRRYPQAILATMRG